MFFRLNYEKRQGYHGENLDSKESKSCCNVAKVVCITSMNLIHILKQEFEILLNGSQLKKLKISEN